MNQTRNQNNNNITSLFFLIVPTIMLIVGYVYYPIHPSDSIRFLTQIPIFIGLLLLICGFLLDKHGIGKILKIFGWIVFAFYWSTQPNVLYVNEGGDIVNATLCIIGVYVLFYLAYHEWLSYNRKETISSLNWITGASAIAGFIYFIIDLTPIAPWLIERVAEQSVVVLNLFAGNATVNADLISYPGTQVKIIFACTAVQSMVIFVGMILPLPKVGLKRKILGLVVTIIPIYFLNLFRNALVVYLDGEGIVDFNIAHNYLAKAGSLIALIILLLILVKILPEIYDEIMSLTNVYKRNGPLEKMFKKVLGKKQK
jgi:archaeosortase A (PGF-CTERM-specific)